MNAPSSHAVAPAISPVAPAISVKNLTMRFGGFQAVSNLSFDVGHGEVFGFIGPNGAGKTTTIRVLSTLLEPTHGTVEVCGKDTTSDPEAVRKLIGYMPDHPAVYERITVAEFLQFFAAAARVANDVVDGVIELTDIGPLRDRMVTSLSKGQKQRVQLARVLLHDPKVLILDEPASDLDPRARIEMRDLLVDLARNGKTIFLSSHILTELAEVCTQVAILERGRLVACGPVDAIGRNMRGELHKDTARVRLLAGNDQALALIRGVPGVHDVAPVQKGILSFSYQGGDATIAQVVRALVSGGVDVIGVEPERSELEQVFLSVTAGEQQ
jgi:ABC-2 type transport system ATP-binding protein